MPTPEAPAAPAAPAAAAPPITPAPPAPAAPPAAGWKPEDGTILGGKPEAKAGEPAAPKAGEPKPGEPAKPQGAPEKYADFKLPEGVKLEGPLMEKASSLFKESGLSQENAQKFVDLQTSYAKEQLAAVEAGFHKTVSDWGAQTKAHFGADFDKMNGLASKALERFGTPELKKFLVSSGLGNHPEIVKAFAKAGLQMGEDNAPEGRRAGGEQKSDAELLYPGMAKGKK